MLGIEGLTTMSAKHSPHPAHPKSDRIAAPDRRPGHLRPGAILLVLWGLAVLPAQAGGACSPADAARCEAIVAVAQSNGWPRQPIGQVVVNVGTQFLGVPYKAKTLEREGPEALVVDLAGLDCTTFVESSLALARAIKGGHPSPAGFERELQSLRYRQGRVEGYPSRLHYFSDWLADAGQRGLVHDLTESLGGVPDDKRIDFMSRHPQAYPQLAFAPYLQAITAIERTISARPRHYLPRTALSDAESRLQPGDVIALTSAVAGLDVSHVGLAVRGPANRIHLMHAPTVGKVVEVSTKPLVDLVGGSASTTGIMVARPLEPVPEQEP